MTELDVVPPLDPQSPAETALTAPPPKKTASARAAAPAAAPEVAVAETVAPEPAPAKSAARRIRLPDTAALKDGAEKARLAVSKAQDYSKQNLAAVVASIEAANKGAAALRSQSLSLSKSLFETSLSSARTLAAAKSLHDVTDVYRDFAKFALDTHLTGVETLTETVSTSFKDAITPLKARVEETLRFGQKAA